jgi:predicted HNH restriction endonuclease
MSAVDWKDIAHQAKEIDLELRRKMDPKATIRKGAAARFKRDQRRKNGEESACEVCGWKYPAPFTRHGQPSAVNAHHVVPISAGGADDEGNLVLLCPNHHAIVHGFWGTKKYEGPRTKEDLVRELKTLDRDGHDKWTLDRTRMIRGPI